MKSTAFVLSITLNFIRSHLLQMAPMIVLELPLDYCSLMIIGLSLGIQTRERFSHMCVEVSSRKMICHSSLM